MMQKERDLELAARIGQSLLKQNQELTARNEMLDEQLEVAKEEVREMKKQNDRRPTPAVLIRVCFADRTTSPRALHAGRPPAVLRQHGGAGERSGTLTVSTRSTTCVSVAQASSLSRGPLPKPGKETDFHPQKTPKGPKHTDKEN